MWFIIPFLVSGINELLKVFFESYKEGRVDFKWFLHPGGMPSGHSAFVSSISTVIYLKEGVSTAFLLSISFALIVMYDARGIRASVEKTTNFINQVFKREKPESIGHTNLEVISGSVISIFLTTLFYKLFY